MKTINTEPDVDFIGGQCSLTIAKRKAISKRTIDNKPKNVKRKKVNA